MSFKSMQLLLAYLLTRLCRQPKLYTTDPKTAFVNHPMQVRQPITQTLAMSSTNQRLLSCYYIVPYILNLGMFQKKFVLFFRCVSISLTPLVGCGTFQIYIFEIALIRGKPCSRLLQ